LDQFFYASEIYDDKVILPEEEAHHALVVLRKHKGDPLQVVDGKGNLYNCILDSVDPENCNLHIIDKQEKYDAVKHYIHIGLSPPKSHDRVEWFVEKATEIGVQEITFIQTQHSERVMIKPKRILKRIIASMKQSLKATLPVINDIIPLSEFIEASEEENKFVGYLGEEDSPLLSKIANPGERYSVLIGPEGDYSPNEIAEVKDFGFKPVSLGRSRLRTETAGVAACHILNIINE
jgi:16S rRNA (uracil1498-N3)-methyltransferase